MEDITDEWKDKIISVEIEERVNSAGICEIVLDNLQKSFINSIWAGQEYAIIIPTEGGVRRDKITFWGYVPPDFLPFESRWSDIIELQLVGMFDKYARNLNVWHNIPNMNSINALRLLCDQVKENPQQPPRGTESPVLEFGTKYINKQWVNVDLLVEKTVDEDIQTLGFVKDVMNDVRATMIDNSDPSDPLFFHFVQVFPNTYQASDLTRPYLLLIKEPSVLESKDFWNNEPLLTVEEEDIISISVDSTGE
jgi:hypothetical protein